MVKIGIVVGLAQVATSLTINGVPARNHPDATVIDNGVVVKKPGFDLNGKPMTKPTIPVVPPGGSAVEVNGPGGKHPYSFCTIL